MTPLLASLLAGFIIGAMVATGALFLFCAFFYDPYGYAGDDLGGSADAMRDETPDDINRPIGIGGAADREGR